jgi:hypothetical protein
MNGKRFYAVNFTDRFGTVNKAGYRRAVAKMKDN